MAVMYPVNFNSMFRIGLVLMSVVLLFGCKAEQTGQGSGSLVLSITDAPVDGATSVVVEFTGVEIQPENGDRIQITYAHPKTIDLLALQGGLRATLIENLDLDVGGYSWIRLKVNAEADGVYDSYIDIANSDSMPDGRYELRVPSGSQSGLKLHNPFTVTDGEILDFTVDFDLRKSVHLPRGYAPMGLPVYFLRPTLRLVQTEATGAIAGVLDPQIFVINELACSANTAGYAVYLFKGDVIPDDIDMLEPNPETTALATLNNSSQYVYTLSFLKPGDYTIAATCAGDADEPDVNDDIPFVGIDMVSVTAGATTPYDFLP